MTDLTRKCRGECGKTFPLTAEHFQWRRRERRTGYVIVYEYDCRPCSRLKTNRRNNKNYVPNGGYQGRTKPQQEFQGFTDDIHKLFFCKVKP
jgi:hypothetical protein